jgi:hypothetical protein
VGDSPPRVAAVSLLVPPVDAEETETEWTRQARQVASCFLRAVRPHCPGMISRYAADFMPRCFGEWVQQQGVATLTVEAGGWLTPEIDSSPLARAHFTGLVSALEAVATQEHLHADPAEYDALPRSGEHDLFDLMIRGVTLLGHGAPRVFTVDLGINVSEKSYPRGQAKAGRIEDMGDLCVTVGKATIDGADLVCVPGRIVYEPDLSPTSLPDAERVRRLLAMGVTTVIGQVDLSDADALNELSSQSVLPINLGWIATVAGMKPEAIHQQLALAASRGVLGVLASSVSSEALRLQIPLLEERDLPVGASEAVSLHELAQQMREVAARLGLGDRGSVELGSVADLILLRTAGAPDYRAAIRWSDLQQVVVAGSVVFEFGELVSGEPRC